MTKIEEQLKKIAVHSGEPYEKVKERFDAFRKTNEAEMPSAPAAELDNCALDALLAANQRKNSSMVKSFSGMFLACDGKVNDWAKWNYEQTMMKIGKKTQEEAYAEGLVDSKGRPLYGKDKRFDAGKVIDPTDIFFEIFGTVLEHGKDSKELQMRFRVTNIGLLRDVRLNTPVMFHASKNVGQTNGNIVYLVSEPNTIFNYDDATTCTPDMAMEWAEKRFPELDVDQLPSLYKIDIDKDGKETIKTDKRLWLLKDLVISYIHKNRVGGRIMIELAHPDLLDWKVVVIYEKIDTAYDLVRDHRANLCGKLRSLDLDNKTIVLDGVGYWQLSSYRDKKPAVDPANTRMSFKD